MNEIGLFAFQLEEILPAIEVFVLCLGIGLGAVSIRGLWCKCCRQKNRGDS